MAALVRSVVGRGIRVLANSQMRPSPSVHRTCLISTSKKAKDAATIGGNISRDNVNSETGEREDWLTHGYELYSEELDNWAKHMTMFVGITLVFCLGGFVIAYMPDYKLHDWSKREAYLELDRRQKAGLPPVDANLIDPQKITLPSDEELGDIEIVV